MIERHVFCSEEVVLQVLSLCPSLNVTLSCFSCEISTATPSRLSNYEPLRSLEPHSMDVGGSSSTLLASTSTWSSCRQRKEAYSMRIKFFNGFQVLRRVSQTAEHEPRRT